MDVDEVAMNVRKFIYAGLSLVFALYVVLFVLTYFAPIATMLGVTPAADSKALRKELQRQRAEARHQEGERMKDATRKKLAELENKIAAVAARERNSSGEMLSIVSNIISVISGILSCFFAWLAYRTQARPGGMQQSMN